MNDDKRTDLERTGADAPPAQNTAAKGAEHTEGARNLGEPPQDDTTATDVSTDPTTRSNDRMNDQNADHAGSMQVAQDGAGDARDTERRRDTTDGSGTANDRAIGGGDNLAQGDTATIDKTLAASPDGSGPSVPIGGNSAEHPLTDERVAAQADAGNAEAADRQKAASELAQRDPSRISEAQQRQTPLTAHLDQAAGDDERSIEQKVIEGAIHLVQAVIASGDVGTDTRVPAVEAASYHLASGKVPNYCLGALQRVYGMGAGAEAGRAFIDGAWVTNHLSVTELAGFKVALSELEAQKAALPK